MLHSSWKSMRKMVRWILWVFVATNSFNLNIVNITILLLCHLTNFCRASQNRLLVAGMAAVSTVAVMVPMLRKHAPSNTPAKAPPHHQRQGASTKASADSSFDSQFKDASNGKFMLPPLPYSSKSDLEPIISATTVEFHYEKHHRGYVNKLNDLTQGSDLAKLSLEELMLKEKQGKVFNLAAQIWNHTFYWNCMQSPKHNGKPNGPNYPEITQARTNMVGRLLGKGYWRSVWKLW